VSNQNSQHDEDAARLAALGYTSEFKREMSLWANFSLGFTYLSPVVGIYTLFAFALATAGPPMIWSLLIVGVGQFLVAQVFSEVVSQYPVAGGVYPWARRLWGKKWAWMSSSAPGRTPRPLSDSSRTSTRSSCARWASY